MTDFNKKFADYLNRTDMISYLEIKDLIGFKDKDTLKNKLKKEYKEKTDYVIEKVKSPKSDNFMNDYLILINILI